MKRLPDFLVIGAQKCGTTALIENISLHPDVYVPTWLRYGAQRPEFHYFNENWGKGVDWYRSIFDSKAKVVGEKSPEYLHEFECHARMKQVVPDCKLFVILRDPIARAYSAFNFARHLYPDSAWFGHDNDLLIEQPIAKAFDQLIQTQLHSHKCFSFGFYARQLQSLNEHFPQEQIFVTTMEQLKSQPELVMPMVFEHIGLEDVGGLDWVDNDFAATPYKEPMSLLASKMLREHYKKSNKRLNEMLTAQGV